VNNTAEEVGKMVNEVNNPEEKQKTLKESGIKVKDDDIELAWEKLMQEKLASLHSKKVVTGKKGRKVQPSAGGGAAEAGDEYGNCVAKKEEEEGEENN
jgi:hypothetical protein